MPVQIPETGKIYVSRTDPGIRIYVEAVHVIEADEDSEAGFCVEGCTPGHENDLNADGIEVYANEWAELDFILDK